MMVQDIIELIEYHMQNNDAMFRNKAYDIAKGLMDQGKVDSAQYILSLGSGNLSLSPQAIKDGNSICLFSIPVRLMEGVSKNILSNVRSNMRPLGIFTIDRYSFGWLLHSHASANAGKRNVPRAEISCNRRIMSGYSVISACKP